MKIQNFLLAGLGALALYAAPARAADDQELNSGFGKDMFAGEEHPAFADPSIHDPAALSAIAPAAGVEQDSTGAAPVPAKDENTGAADTARDKKLPPGTGGMESTFTNP